MMMYFAGFSEAELKKITEILDLHQVLYEIIVPHESILGLYDVKKRREPGFLDSLIEIQIAESEFSKIPPEDILKLHDLRIYQEYESPFSEVELLEMNRLYEKKEDPHQKLNQAAALLAITVMLLLFFWSKGYL